jgi:hypothetical protein
MPRASTRRISGGLIRSYSGILASDRRCFQDIARLQPSPTQLVEVAKAVELDSAAHVQILGAPARLDTVREEGC